MCPCPSLMSQGQGLYLLVAVLLLIHSHDSAPSEYFMPGHSWKLQVTLGFLQTGLVRGGRSKPLSRWVGRLHCRCSDPHRILEYQNGNGVWRPWRTLMFLFFYKSSATFSSNKLFSRSPACQTNQTEASLFGTEAETRVCLVLFSFALLQSQEFS